MSGDFSRLTFDAAKHYDGVLLQQGRPQLDADWNEQWAIDAHRREVQTRDTIGLHGAPRDHAGFGISLRAGLDFDGRDDVARLSPSGTLHGLELERFALELHLSLPTDHDTAGVLVSSDRGQWRLQVEADGRVAVYMRGGDADDSDERPHADGAAAVVASQQPLELGQWSWVGLACDGEQLRLLFDGQAVGEAGCPFVGRGHRAPTTLGGVSGRRSTVGHFRGQLDEIRVWDSAIAAAHVQGAHSGPLLAPTRGLLAYWPMLGADREQLLRDATGNDNDLTLGAASPGWVGRDLVVGRGRMYVDGILCENEHRLLLSQQLDSPGEGAGLDAQRSGRWVAYIDVWRREIDALLDPTLRDVALGGADTAIRSRVVWQVRSLSIPSAGGDDDDHDWRRDWQSLLSGLESTGTLRARRQSAAGTDLGNQLYRIEIHHGGGPGEATFKWSRDNASISFAVESVDAPGGVAVVSDLGHDAYALQTGDWVEYVDDELALQQRPGPLLQVTSIDRARNQVAVAGDALQHISLRTAAHARLRRWDQGAVASELVVPDGPDTWTTLENGVQVAFGDGTYHSGDYWVVPARAALEDVDWPTTRETGPIAQPPHGVGHHYCPLAVVHLDPERPRVQDERRLFEPLTSLLEREQAERVAGDVPEEGIAREGDLRVEGELSVAGDAHLHGHVRVGRLSGALGPDLVQTENLVDGAVTRRKIAPDAGFVPVGYSILGDSPQPPPGYEHHGASIVIDRPALHRTLQVDEPGTVTGVAIGDELYVVSDLGTVWSYDVSDDRLREVARLERSRLELSAVAGDGRLLLIGGLNTDGEPTAAVTELDLETFQWQERAPLPLARTQAGIAAMAGQIHVVGGRRRGGEPVAQHDVYDLEADAWTRRADLPAPRRGLAAASVGGRLFAIGGEQRGRQWRGAAVGRNEEFDPQRERWSECAALPGAWRRLAIVAADERLFVVGGTPPPRARTAGSVIAHRSTYDPATNWWSQQPPLPRSPNGLSLARVGSTIYAVGSDDSAIRLDAVQQTLYIHRCVAG